MRERRRRTVNTYIRRYVKNRYSKTAKLCTKADENMLYEQEIDNMIAFRSFYFKFIFDILNSIKKKVQTWKHNDYISGITTL